MRTQDPNRFNEIVEAARERRADASADTTIVSGHLAQMRMFMLRQGVEFYPRQDTYGFRRSFLERIIEENEIDQRLEGIVDDFICQGVGLWFFRPVGDSYRIMWFSKENYRAYYDASEQLEELDLIYSYRARAEIGATGALAPGGVAQKYVRLRVRRDELIESISSEKPSFDTPMPPAAVSLQRRTTRNSLGFIPAVEAFNWMRATGMDATGDFAGHEGHIMVHDGLVKNIRENIRFYGNPTLVSSRPRHDLVEAGGDSALQRPTISSRSGFSSADRPSSRFSVTGAPTLDGGVRVPRLIANLEATDRVQYITPNAVSGDQNLYARQYREEVRTALGGVDELGISSGATAYEIKSLFGRAATTASRKCRGLLTYGLCKLLALMIHNEERIFRESFAIAAKIKVPQPPILEEMDGDREAYEKARQDFLQAFEAFEGKVATAIDKAIEAQKLPSGVVGLIPDGDRRVEWRWRGPVFEESTDDILNNSIVVRNLQELGVNSIEALRYLFPSKTDEERSAMLNGYPFRLAQATQQSISTFLGLIGAMQQTPHPQAPNLPLLADARLDLTPFLYRTFDFLKRELTYAGQFGDAAGSGEPAELDPIQRARVGAGLPIDAPGTDAADFVPDAAQLPAAGGSGGSGSLAGGVREPVRPFERDAPIPSPGALLARDPVGSRLPGALPFGSTQLPAGTQLGDADLLSPSNAGVFAELSERVAKRRSARSERAKPAGRRTGRPVSERRQ